MIIQICCFGTDLIELYNSSAAIRESDSPPPPVPHHYKVSATISNTSLHLGPFQTSSLLSPSSSVDPPILGLSLMDTEISCSLFQSLDQSTDSFQPTEMDPNENQLLNGSADTVKLLSLYTHFYIYTMLDDHQKIIHLSSFPSSLNSPHRPISFQFTQNSVTQPFQNNPIRSSPPIHSVQSFHLPTHCDNHLKTFALVQLPDVLLSISPNQITDGLLPIVSHLSRLIQFDQTSEPMVELGLLEFDMQCSNFTLVVVLPLLPISLGLRDWRAFGTCQQLSQQPLSQQPLSQQPMNNDGSQQLQWFLSANVQIRSVTLSVGESSILTTHSSDGDVSIDVRVVLGDGVDHIAIILKGIDIDLGGHSIVPILDQAADFQTQISEHIEKIGYVDVPECQIYVPEDNIITTPDSPTPLNIQIMISRSSIIIPVATLQQLAPRLIVTPLTTTLTTTPLTTTPLTTIPLGIFTVVVEAFRIDLNNESSNWNRIMIKNDGHLMVQFNSSERHHHRPTRLLKAGLFEIFLNQNPRSLLSTHSQQICRIHSTSIDVLLCTLSVDALRQLLCIMNHREISSSLVPSIDDLTSSLSIEVMMDHIEISLSMLSRSSVTSEIQTR